MQTFALPYTLQMQRHINVSDQMIIRQYLPEDCGKYVGKDGDNDENHEGEDDEGGKATADVLPTSRGKT